MPPYTVYTAEHSSVSHVAVFKDGDMSRMVAAFFVGDDLALEQAELFAKELAQRLNADGDGSLPPADCNPER